MPITPFFQASQASISTLARKTELQFARPQTEMFTRMQYRYDLSIAGCAPPRLPSLSPLPG